MFTLSQTTVYTTIYLKRNIVYFATQVPDTSDPIAIRTTLVWHEWDTSVTRVLHERHECDTSATRLKNFDFDNDTSENIFPHPYNSYIANERLQGEERFNSKNYLLEMTRSHAKTRLKCTTKYELCGGKRYIKKLFPKLLLQLPLHVPA